MDTSPIEAADQDLIQRLGIGFNRRLSIDEVMNRAKEVGLVPYAVPGTNPPKGYSVIPLYSVRGVPTDAVWASVVDPVTGRRLCLEFESR